MSVRQTSLEAYKEIQHELGKRQRFVYEGFYNHGQHTNLEISVLLKLPINQVTPRTNELVKKRRLIEIGKRTCNISGRNAIVWGIK